MDEQPKIKDLLYEIERLKKENTELKISRPYGLVWEDKPEQFEADSKNALPVLVEKGGRFKDVDLDPSAGYDVLIEGDNYHALSVLAYTHKGKVDLIYIDPPYNTGARDWKYNNDYVDSNDLFRHSKWLSFMYKRLVLAKDLLKPDGVVIVTIDDWEAHNLQLLLEAIFPERELTTVVIEHNPKGSPSRNFTYSHEYALFMIPRGQSIIGNDPKEKEDTRNLRRAGRASMREDRPTMFYPIYVKNGKVLKVGMPPKESFHPKGRNTVESDGVIAVWPIDEQGKERRWHFGLDSIDEYLSRIEVKGQKGDIQLYVTAVPGRYKTVWTGGDLDAGKYGTTLVKDILGTEFPFPKSLYATARCLETVVLNRPNALIVDFFAGSGTTGHAVLQLNKQFGGNRKFVLCTNNEGNICEDVTYKRLKKVMEGYSDSSKRKIQGLGGNLKYLKRDFVPKHVEYGLTDEARLDLTRRANLLLALKEGTFTPVLLTDRYDIYSSPTNITGIYFTEDKSDVNKMLEQLNKHAEGRRVRVYVFSWEKGAYKSGSEEYPDFEFEDIPEPILEVYRSIGY